ncbi:MAG: FAD-dependent oxidoreductase [Patescibacteria group bacterium]
MIYDLIIVGAGPAGLSASIYASRAGLKHLLIGQMEQGLTATIFSIENYPGFENISGPELMQKFSDQAKKYNAEILSDEVINIKKEEEIFKIKTKNNKNFESKTIILAYGNQRRKLNVPGEQEFTGKGVSYCAVCDGPLYKNKTVAVVGGGNSALSSAIFLAKQAAKVYLISIYEQFKGQTVLQEQIQQEKKIIPIVNHSIKEIRGKDMVQEIILNTPSKETEILKLDGVFVEIGYEPSKNLSLFDSSANPEKNKAGYIQTDYLTRTNIPGLFAAGDIAGEPDKLRQIITASAEGSISAIAAFRFCQKPSDKK